MRAIKVNERIDFKRGQDPKGSMGIGLSSKAFPIIGINIGYGWKKWSDAEEILKDLLSYIGEIPAHYNMVTVLKDPKYTGAVSETWLIRELKFMKYTGIKCGDTFVPFGKSKSRVSQNESVSFERGKDPKEAMGIGKIKEIQRWLEYFHLDNRSNIAKSDGGKYLVYVQGGITFSNFTKDHMPDMPTNFPMDVLTIGGSFYMDRSDFTELPEQLTVNGVLDLSNYKGKSLPKKLFVERGLTLTNVKNPLIISSGQIDGKIYMNSWDFDRITIPDKFLDQVTIVNTDNVINVNKLSETAQFQRDGDPLPQIGIGRNRFGKSKMGPGHEVIWSNGSWNLESYVNPNTGKKNLVVVGHDEDEEDGVWDHTDYPILYDNGSVGFDNPYLIPADVKAAVRELYPTLRESVNFERGKDPKKTLGIGRVRPYPQMTISQFQNWYKEEIEPYLPEDGPQAIVDNLLMNDWEKDYEVAGYLRDRNISEDLVKDLIYMRGYFNDIDYSTRLFDENLF